MWTSRGCTAMHQAGAFFVTRAKSNMDARRVYSAPLRARHGRDLRPARDAQWLLLRQDLSRASAAHSLQGPGLGQDAGLPDQQHRAARTDDLRAVQERWQVELFFKWIKQHLRIKKFLGTSENAVKTQIWCAVATYVLIAIVKKELQLDASLYTCLQILSVSVFEKTQLSCALQPDDPRTKPPVDANQLILFNF